MNGEITSPKSSLGNNLLVVFFLILSLGGIVFNLIFQKIIRIMLSMQGLETDVIENIGRHFTLIGTGVTITGIVMFLCVARFLSGRITGPMNQLTKKMVSLAEGKWDTRIKMDSNDELGQLAEGFNFMAERIEESLQKLKIAKEYTDNIVRSVPSILIVLSNRLTILSTNMAYEKLKEQFPKLTYQQFIQQLEEEIQKNLKTGETMRKEIVIIPEEAEISLIFSVMVSRIGDSGPEDKEEKARILLTITNITERIRMKEMVLQSKQDWEDTFNTIPDMITIHDKDFNIIHANKAAQVILNLPDFNFTAANKCFKYYHGTENPPAGCPSCECLKTSESATFEVFEPHLNKFIEIRSIPRINSNNKMIGLIHIVRDISLKKETEKEHNQLLAAITKAKIEWEMTFDSAMEFIVLTDKELLVTRCNKSFSDYVGEPIDNIVGNYCHDFFPCSEEQVKECKEIIKSNRKLRSKSELKTDSGRWLSVSHRPVHDDTGRLLKSLIIATDITEFKTAQQKIRESEEELKKKVADLEKFYDLAIGRELRMKELKKEIKRLEARLTQDAAHESVKG